MHTTHVFIRDVLPGSRPPAATGAAVARSLPWAVTVLATGAVLPIAGALTTQVGVLRAAAVLQPDAVVGAGVLAVGLVVTLWYALTGAALLLSHLLRRELGVARWGAPFARRLALGAGLGLLAVSPAQAEAPDDLSWGAPAVWSTVDVAAEPVRTAPSTPPREDAPLTEGATHVVVAGECLWEIAEREFTSPSDGAVAERVAEWIGANPGLAANPDLIHPGDVLVVPDGAGR